MRTRSSKEFAAAAEESKEEASATPKTEKPVVDEEAADSDKPTYTLEDVERAKQLFSDGKRNYLCGSMAEAADALAQASEIFGGFYGESARECAEIYYYYGRALLELARKEPDVVAGAVEGTCLAKIDAEGAEQDNETAEAAASDAMMDTESAEPDVNLSPDEVREKVLDALDENAIELEKEAAKKAAKAAGETSGAGDAPADPEIATGEETTKNDGAAGNTAMQEETTVAEEVGEDDTAEGDQSEGEENKENNPVVEEETVDEIPNLQLSWEVLDMARVILEKSHDKESEERLADCRLALGEQAMEDEQFDKAIAEFVAALEIQEKLMPEDDRRIALSHFNIGVARNLKEDYEQAVVAFEHAVVVLKLRHGNLQTKLAELKEGGEAEKNELEADIKDLEALISDVENRIQDCVESRVESDAAKQAMNNEKAKHAEEGEKMDEASKVTDVTHLVRKSVKRDGGPDMEEPAKKAKADAGEVNGKNGHGPENGEKQAANGVAAE